MRAIPDWSAVILATCPQDAGDPGYFMRSKVVKRYSNLYPKITTFENLHKAYHKAAKGKRRKPEVAAFEFDLESNLLRLEEALVAKTYRPGDYHSFYIRDPKHRLVSAAPFCDRIVHHALCNVIEPIFERTFIGDSYANRVGKGTHAALDRCQHFTQQYRYVLQCDIVKFFPSVDLQILRGILARKLADDDVLWLCDLILDGGAGVLENEYTMRWFPGDDLFAQLRPRGLPIGNLTSQFWANVLLNELDQFVKRELRCAAFLRYVDDFCLFSDSKRELWAWKDAVRWMASASTKRCWRGNLTVCGSSHRSKSYVLTKIGDCFTRIILPPSQGATHLYSTFNT